MTHSRQWRVRCAATLIQINGPSPVRYERRVMTLSDEKPPADEEVRENQSRTSELRRMIEECARDLRRIIEKLRKRLH
jgi:predicted esterase